jgi:hypothetical protein
MMTQVITMIARLFLISSYFPCTLGTLVFQQRDQNWTGHLVVIEVFHSLNLFDFHSPV